MPFDYFVAALRCAACGAVSPPDGTTDMQTALRREARHAYLGVGAAVDTDPEDFRNADYLSVQDSIPGGEIRILQVWGCRSCGRISNWARIVVKDGLIREIASIELTRAELERSHYISEEDGRTLAAQLTGRPSIEIYGPPVVQILREHLR